MMKSLSSKCKEYDMKIHVNKTKVMKISSKLEENLSIIINGQKVKRVSQFKYLGSLLTEDAGSGKEIKTSVAMAKEAFNNKKMMLTKSMRKDVKNSKDCGLECGPVWSRNIDTTKGRWKKIGSF